MGIGVIIITISALTNTFVLSAISEATKNALQNIQEYWPQLNEVPSPAQSFINLLEFPITHVQQYEEFIGKLEISWPKVRNT